MSPRPRVVSCWRYPPRMPSGWPAMPTYDEWSATCDTLHAHTQVLGKLAVALAPPEPELQHAALRLTARGWETIPLPAPDGSGAFVVALDLHRHEALVEHSGGATGRVPLTPDRAVGEVTRELLAAIGALAGAVEINPTPQEVSWSVPLDEDDEHARYEPDQRRVLLRGRHSCGARASRVPCALSRPLDPGERLVGLVRPRGQPVLGAASRPAVAGLHHAQRDGCTGGRDWLVARRCTLRSRGVLRLRAPGAGRVRRRDARPGGGAVGRGARRVRPRLGRRPR